MAKKRKLKTPEDAMSLAHPVVELEYRSDGSIVWPKRKKMPVVDASFSILNRRIPCPKCRSLYGPGGQQAVRVRATHPSKQKKYLECRVCDHRWTLV